MPIYQLAPKEVAQRAGRMIEAHHPDIENAKVQIDYLYAYAKDPEEPGLKLHGYPALAICKITSLKDRVKGMGDCEISIDAKRYSEMSDAQKDALLDHELEHIQIKRDEDGLFKTDDIGRPALKMKLHDFDFGWFSSIAQRHGNNSIEVQQAHSIFDSAGQYLFPSLAPAALPAPKASNGKKKK